MQQAVVQHVSDECVKPVLFQNQNLQSEAIEGNTALGKSNPFARNPGAAKRRLSLSELFISEAQIAEEPQEVEKSAFEATNSEPDSITGTGEMRENHLGRLYG